MPIELEASFYVEDPPEVTYRNGMYHLARKVGGYRFECVMRPHVYFQMVRLLAEAAKLHRFGGAEVIDFPTDATGTDGH